MDVHTAHGVNMLNVAIKKDKDVENPRPSNKGETMKENILFDCKDFMAVLLAANIETRGKLIMPFDLVKNFSLKLFENGINNELKHSDFNTFIEHNSNDVSMWGGRLHVEMTQKHIDKHIERIDDVLQNHKEYIQWLKMC